MLTFQKTIKYLAIAFAFFLIFTIFQAILFGISSFSFLFSEKGDNGVTKELTELVIKEKISSIDIDVTAVSVIFKESDIFRVETNNKYIKYDINKDNLLIQETKHSFISRKKIGELIIYLPKDVVFDTTILDLGAGRVNIETLKTRKLDIDFGAGEVKIGNLFVTDQANISTGAGKVRINYSEINDLDLDLGVGEFSLTSRLSGKSEVDAGVGEVNLNLYGTSEDYSVEVDGGLGEIKVDGKRVKDGSYGSGNSIIEIDGGVGNIDIKFVPSL